MHMRKSRRITHALIRFYALLNETSGAGQGGPVPRWTVNSDHRCALVA